MIKTIAGWDGLAMFYASGDMVSDPDERAQYAKDCGATTTFLLIESVEGTRRKPTLVAEHALACRVRDVTPILFTFPTSDRIDSSLAHLGDCAKAANIGLVVLDIEPWKDQHGVTHDWTPAEIARLVAGARALGLDVIVTLYSRALWHHVSWQHVAPNCPIILQVYSRVADERQLSDAVAAFPGSVVVLAIGTYVGDVARLEHDIAHARTYSQKTKALAVWVLRSTSPQEQQTLRRAVPSLF